MKITVREWVKKYQNGEFSGPFQTDDSCFEVMVKAGWYDWFCDTKNYRNDWISSPRFCPGSITTFYWIIFIYASIIIAPFTDLCTTI